VQKIIYVLIAGAACFPATAHDIPNDVTAQLFLKPEGTRLNLLARVPLKAVRDVAFPERRGGYLDVERADPLLHDAALQWIADFIVLDEGESRLPKKPLVRGAILSLESDRSFASYEDARAHLAGPRLDPGTNVVWSQTMLDVWLEYPIRSDRSQFSIQPELARLGQHVVTVLRFLPPGGAVRAFEFQGDPGLVHLDPRWHQATMRFVGLGFDHILDGTDHLLFLFCLVIPLRRVRALIKVVTAFTVAHSITLIASAYNLGADALWFPPLIETLIAVSILYMALENIAGGAGVERRWIIAFGFGLVHGFGFSFALRQTLQFAGSHLLASLLSFNFGVELGQMMVLLIMIPLLGLLFRYVVTERIGTIILSALVAHTAWHWMSERFTALRGYRFAWPDLTASLLVTAMRWLTAAVILAGLVWLVRELSKRRITSEASQSAVSDKTVEPHLRT
jgi:hypothetical protein